MASSNLLCVLSVFSFLLQLSSLVEYSGECHKIDCQFLRSPSRWIVGTSLGIQVGHKNDVHTVQFSTQSANPVPALSEKHD